MHFIKPTRLGLLAILLVALAVRLINLGTPETYYFDEVYHAVTAKAYAVNNPAGYEWWHPAPEPGTAFEWLHPPVAKLIMALGWNLFGQTAWAWRFPGVLFGIATLLMIYWAASLLTNDRRIGLLASFLASLDGLLLAQSRIGMNDIYVTFFITAAVTAYIKSRMVSRSKWLWWSGIMTGLAVSTKWSGIFTLGIIGVFELVLWYQSGFSWFTRFPKLVLVYILIPACIYIASFSQFWLQGHTWDQFSELHSQIWWYQTHLEATHSYQSKAWEWPLLIRPVWYFVNYLPDGKVVNIYNLANPALAWLGLLAVLSLIPSIRIDKKESTLTPSLVIITAYALVWMPWLISPRIMFFYHYAPAIPWLSIGLSYQLSKLWRYKYGTEISAGVVALIVIAFIILSPMWLSIPLPAEWWSKLFFLPSWK